MPSSSIPKWLKVGASSVELVDASSTPPAARLTYDSIVTRSVEKRGSRIFEFFRLTLLKGAGDSLPADDEPNELRVDSYIARHLPKLGPGVVYRRTLREATDPFDSAKYLGDNLGPPQTFGQGALRVVALDDVVPMPDGEFWALVERSARGETSASVTALSKDLEVEGLSATLAFARALELRLSSLVRSELGEVGLRMPGNAPLSADAALYLGCAIVLDGKTRYERSLADPTIAWSPGELFDAEELLSAAPEAFTALTGQDAVFTSAISRELDRGVDRGADGGEVFRPDTPQAERRAEWEENSRFIAEVLGMEVDGEVWLKYENRACWISARFIARFDSAFEEAMLIFPVREVDGQVPVFEVVRGVALKYAEQWVHSEGGLLMPGLEVENAAIPYLREGDLIFWIERKYDPTLAEYVAEFGLG